jgi:flavodoxin
MSTIVVYESVYGNTHEIAKAIAEGLGPATLVSVREAVERGVEPGDLIVIGGPTHIRGLATRRTRKAALEDGKPHHLDPSAADEPSLKSWLDSLSPRAGRKAAAFDTRINKARWITGTAARGIARRLRRHGVEVVATESFLVAGGEGPLVDGELERARAWGEELFTGSLCGLPRAGQTTGRRQPPFK